ncbi:MAG: nicotinate-nucleotide--dimethylbenzimidazole phosphoribosyltransferase [Oscillospiraceae bacterium]|jgi:nicotinate-nucleotide--dimethylbenzimidazole phosphoribosyltransferase
MNEKELRAILQQIVPPDQSARAAAQIRWNQLAKPLGSLGLLEEQIMDLVALTGDVNIQLQKRALLVLCADNGVVANSVTQTDSSVTAAVANALAAGESTVCHMAQVARCQVVPVDMGIQDFPGVPGVLPRRVRNSTGDIARVPAMNRGQCLSAIKIGMDLVLEQKQQGVSILATGEMGIGNTTTSSAVAAVLLEQPPERVTGRGAGLSDDGLFRKQEIIRTAIALHQPNREDPIGVLAALGGLDLAGLCGVFLGGAIYRVPILIDGFISAVAALCAVMIHAGAAHAMFASHVSAEPAGGLILEALGKKPLITAEMRLGEGSGAIAALPLLDMALAVYQSGQTFDHLGIPAYTAQ